MEDERVEADGDFQFAIERERVRCGVRTLPEEPVAQREPAHEDC